MSADENTGHAAAVTRLAAHVGREVASTCGRHLDTSGLLLLAGTFASMSDDERCRQVAEVESWATKLREVVR
jgi:hypothetical protein